MLNPKTAKADVEPIRQRTQFTCMAASMAMCLQAHGHENCDEDKVNKVMGAQPMQGATWEQALACAQHYGMRGTLTSPCTVKQLKAWTDAGTPVIIAWNPEGREWSHASVVFDVDDEGNVSVADPNIPNPEETVRVVPQAEFYSKWYEKWPDFLVRRPAMAIEREITSDGRQVQAGKKDMRSQKDRAMSRFLKQGPPTHEEESDAAQRMRRVLWEQGAAGLPGAGMGAGAHKDKSRYDRKRERQVDRDASLTQPLMTRRDYGVTMKTSEFAHILKTAEVPPKEAKFERGVSMTVDEVAKVVGPEFKEMNEDPPDSVIKVREKMQDKTAAKGRATHLENPKKAGFTLCGEQTYPDTLVDSVKDTTCAYCKSAWQKAHGGHTAGHRLSIDMYADLLKNSKFEQGKSVPLSDLPEELQENVKDPPESVVKVREQMENKTGDLLGMDEFAEALKEGKFEKDKPADPTENMSPEDAAEWEKQTELHKDEFKTAAVQGSGKYGFTKAVESACTVGTNRLQKAATRIAKELYGKDEGSPAFLAKHSTKGGSKSATMLLKAMEGIGPMAGLGKTAGKTGNSLYGFSSKTAKLGLAACADLKHEAGEIACDTFARQGADPMKIAAYLATHAKKAKCAYSAMLGECGPDIDTAVISSKKASDFMADESTHPSFLSDQDAEAAILAEIFEDAQPKC